jgi:hypothetical protein
MKEFLKDLFLGILGLLMFILFLKNVAFFYKVLAYGVLILMDVFCFLFVHPWPLVLAGSVVLLIYFWAESKTTPKTP